MPEGRSESADAHRVPAKAEVEEIPAAKKAIKFLGGGEPRIHPVDLPGASGHVVVIIPKIGRTDPRYPRPPSLAKNRPIG